MYYLNLYININFLMQHLTIAETAAVLAHEALHVITHTFPNEMGRLRKIWNFATDYIMNSEIVKVSGEKLNLPEGCVVPLTEDKKPYDGKGTPYLHFWSEDRRIDIMIPMLLPNGKTVESPEQVYDLIILAIKKHMEENEKENPEEPEDEEGDTPDNKKPTKAPPEEIKVGDNSKRPNP
jgi:predicted metal-dependent peptidase